MVAYLALRPREEILRLLSVFVMIRIFRFIDLSADNRSLTASNTMEGWRIRSILLIRMRAKTEARDSAYCKSSTAESTS
jgi:hypothetical protein